jgi:hypothetical protein
MLIFKSLFSFILLLLLLPGITVTASNVDLGIQKDFQGQNTDIQSYSGWVKWHDQTDLQSLTDTQLLNFAKLAYDRMVDIHRSTLLPSDCCRGAMAVLTIGQDIFFGSSMKNSYQVYYKSQSSQVGQYLSNCQGLSDSVHRTNLACGEPNVLDVAMHTGQAEPSYGDGRMAIWGTWTVLGKEECLNPCMDRGSSYGCKTLLSAFEISKWAPRNTNPDYTDGTQWASNFDVQNVPQRSCS